jgi:hypothetical protein
MLRAWWAHRPQNQTQAYAGHSGIDLFRLLHHELLYGVRPVSDAQRDGQCRTVGNAIYTQLQATTTIDRDKMKLFK